jgi:tetratricopeptide (TPR) repeat protein
MFCADQGRDLDAALELARKDLELRSDVFAHDTLAWVYYKKGQIAEADQEMGKALSRGTQTAPPYYHDGMIAKASGDQDRAATFFSIARRLNPYLMKAAKLD